jgi:hypothetical protein
MPAGLDNVAARGGGSENHSEVLVHQLVVGRHHQNDWLERPASWDSGLKLRPNSPDLSPPLSGQRISAGFSDSVPCRLAGYL